MIKRFVYVFLIAGFLTIAFICVSVSAKTYTSWIWHRNNLSHQQITPDDASNAVRDVTLKTNSLVRQTIWPAIVMLIGGLMIGIQPKRKDPNNGGVNTR
jgi:hypothetical protein